MQIEIDKSYNRKSCIVIESNVIESTGWLPRWDSYQPQRAQKWKNMYIYIYMSFIDFLNTNILVKYVILMLCFGTSLKA